MGVLKLLEHLVPRSLEGQLVAVTALSLTLLLAVLAAIEIARQDTTIESAESEPTLSGLRRVKPLIETSNAGEAAKLLALTSSCHRGFLVGQGPFSRGRRTGEARRLENRIAAKLGLDRQQVQVAFALLTRDDFSYAQCSDRESSLPVEGIVISLALQSGLWLQAEVHPHEWHTAHILGWLTRTGIAFLFVGGSAILLIRRLSRPLRDLTQAARQFGEHLEALEVAERGPPDLRSAIEAFNSMQRQVTGEVERRANTLAAVSHDLRTPLTALRIKAELVEDVEVRRDLIESLDGMERIAVSALDYLKGESRAEPMQRTDLSALVESECDNFKDLGAKATFIAGDGVLYTCRPDAIARALRNLIENAIKYGGSATVEIRSGAESVDIVVVDQGPGIASDEIDRALEPFERLSTARESSKGGFGLGLAIAKAVCEGHHGQLVLTNNDPTGLIATMKLPA